MTPEQHKIERMKAWVAFMAAGIAQSKQSDAPVYDVCDHATIADHALAAFDARFPAPKEAPKEPDWIPHTPGNPRPCGEEMIIEYKHRSGSVLGPCKTWMCIWDTTPDYECQTIAWRPAQ